MAQFILLLKAVEPQLTTPQATEITQATSDWVRGGLSNGANSAASASFAAEYAKRNPPYQAAHMAMVSISELRLVAGITAQLYQQLAPNITALPPQITAININSASLPVIMSLGMGLTRSQAGKIIAARHELEGFQTVKDFNKVITNLKIKIPENSITFTSQYFMTKAIASRSDQHLVLYTLIQRTTSNNAQLKQNTSNDHTVKIAIIRQSQGDV